jgi:hypothetical protein
LPAGLTNQKIVLIVLGAQPDLVKKPRYRKNVKKILEGPICEEILKNVFWFFMIDLFQPELRDTYGQIIFEKTSKCFAILVMEQSDEDLKNTKSSSISTGQDNFLVGYPQV